MRPFGKTKQIHKMTTTFTQNGPGWKKLSLYEFAQFKKKVTQQWSMSHSDAGLKSESN